MGREGRDYWEAQLSEYWDSGLTIQEYSEQKELPYERYAPSEPHLDLRLPACYVFPNPER